MSDGVFRRGSVEFDDKIKSVNVYETGSANVGPYLIPGLVDVHTHGALGSDFSDNPSGMQEISLNFAKNGVTSFLATTLTAPINEIEGAVRYISEFRRPQGGARCAGINIEGPFLSYDKRGAHQAALLRLPEISIFERLYGLSGESIKLISVAPELEGALEFIRVVSKITKVSLAHSAADYKTAMLAFANGATQVTHLFNGMNSFLHREPGIIGAALDANAFVEVICDGYHLHPAMIRTVFRLFPQRTCMISDSLRCAGLPDGEYESAGLAIILKDGKATLKNGGGLAGSSVSLMQAVRIAVSIGIPLADAVTAAAVRSAEAIGMGDTVGKITTGAFADLVLLDSELRVKEVYIDGKETGGE